MHIESVTLSSFRCFGPEPISVPISSEITAVVGPNAAGKTALLHALSKLFGVLAHVPASEQRSSTNTALLKDWCAAWRADQRAMEGTVSFDVAGANVLRWHWREVFRLCDGLHPDEHAPGERGRTLRDVLGLGVHPRRQGGPISEQMIIFSDRLQDDILGSACENRMDFLSAFDDSAWETLAKGWELQEFQDRRRVAALRDREVFRLRMIYASDADRMAAEIQRLIESWPADPRRRERSWAGWWLGANV